MLGVAGVRPVVDELAWQNSWQTPDGRLLDEHLDEEPAGLPDGVVIAGAPISRTERRYVADGLGSVSSEVFVDRYTMFVEMPGVQDSLAASAYVAGTVADAVAGLDEYPDRRAGAYQEDDAACVELSQGSVSYEISVVERPLPPFDSEARPVLELRITRRIAVSLLEGGFDQ